MLHERLKQLRKLMAKANIDYYYVPAVDAHQNEYVPNVWQRRAWISGFTGSAGDALIGKEKAYLWTDGRYFLQAEQQLDPNLFQLMKQQSGALPIDRWLMTQGKKLRIGTDPTVMTLHQAQQWQAALQKTDSKLIAIEKNWIDFLWENQPSIPTSPIFPLDITYTGRSTLEKLNDLRNALKQQHAEAIVITRLDDIAWLFNIRGNDIPYNPLAISYAIVTMKNSTLFIHPEKIIEKNYFQSQEITVSHYQDFQKALKSLKTSILIDPNGTNWWTHQQLKKSKIILIPSPITLMKAIKNPIEQNGMQEAHRMDAIAMVKFMHWLDQHWQKGITEISAAQQLEMFRRENNRCRDLSFNTISGFAKHGAIIHYSATESTNKIIDDSALYLIDSGGQYYEGTTDITRTLHLGQPTAEEKQHYTLVLKGHLALRHALFPAGTCGEQIDSLARYPLWQAGYNYSHGTGHGVGCYLCVHEGPQSISSRLTRIPLEPGMAVSNEPGLYFKDRYGIRIENVCLIVKDENHPDFYTLKDLTLVPYARYLIDTSLLSAQEIIWIDQYHQQIFDRIAPDLTSDISEWLKKATNPLKNG